MLHVTGRWLGFSSFLWRSGEAEIGQNRVSVKSYNV